jgi:hypothetical protein
MKSLVTLTGATVALIAGSAMAFADLDVIDHSGQTSAPSIRDQAALNACADAFLARIALGAPQRLTSLYRQASAAYCHRRDRTSLWK